jgi:hypothetical protein
MYPAAPNFTTNVQGDAWYFDERPPRRVCQTNGFDIFASMSGSLFNVLDNGGNKQSWVSYDGSSVTSTNDTANTVDVPASVPTFAFHSRVFRAMWAVANHFNAPANFLSAILTGSLLRSWKLPIPQ